VLIAGLGEGVRVMASCRLQELLQLRGREELGVFPRRQSLQTVCNRVPVEMVKEPRDPAMR
jgi:hypothetical protein